MGYVRTAGMSTAARRARRRAALVILTLLLGLLLAFGIAVATMQGWLTFGDDNQTDEVAVTTTAAPVLTPADINVDVYNSTDTAGLAGRAGEALRTRGYAVDQVGNADAEIEGVAELRHGPEGLAAAQALQEALPEGVTLVEIEREDDKVDLVLGDAWEDLPTAEDAAEEDGR
ncbi:LytR C-terminal domain-containing protein [Ornithinimicrobium panacihumi]|uniref:LytR C-terminal domain-containing protein n=1 Tax=Ornithinimicrobium panacihumi TaxID=2008449 RepID=UPI003F8CE940